MKPKARSKEVTSRIMSCIRSSGSKAELSLGKAMWELGLRYRKHSRALIGTPDYVFASARVVVFCDGDFWHGRDFSQRVRNNRFKNNRDYWLKKIPRNMKHDKTVTRVLRNEGWAVFRFWESDILRDPRAEALVVRDWIKYLGSDSLPKTEVL